MIITGANTGSIEIIKCAREHRSGWCDIMIIIIKNGNLVILKYLHKEGCPWNEESCQVASKNGHLEILKYLHEKRSSWYR